MSNLIVTNPVLGKNLEHLHLTSNVVTWVRFGGKRIYSIQFQPICHMPTKIIKIRGNLTKL